MAGEALCGRLVGAAGARRNIFGVYVCPLESTLILCVCAPCVRLHICALLWLTSYLQSLLLCVARVCVCVHPWTKGFLRPLQSGRGMERTCEAPSNEAPHMLLGYRPGRWPTYLLVLSQAVTPLFHFLVHGSSRFPPHKHSSPAAVQPVRVSAACECQHCSTIQFKLTFPPCCSIAFLPNETIALTENPSSKCVLLSRPTRVLSVIPVTGAPILYGKATTPTHHRSLDSHRKAPTPSQNQLPHRPPGQKTVLEEYIGFQLSDFRLQISFHVFKEHT